MRERITLALFTIALLIVGACGDSGTVTTVDGASSIDVVGKEFEFLPDLWQVAAGDEVSVTLSNEGTIEHNFIILSESITDEEQFNESLAIVLLTTAAGETTSGTFTAPAAGTYQVICNIAGHFGAGMVGQLTVSG